VQLAFLEKFRFPQIISYHQPAPPRPAGLSALSAALLPICASWRQVGGKLAHQASQEQGRAENAGRHHW